MTFSNIITNIDDFKNAIDNGFKYKYSEHYSDDYYGAKIETVVYILEKDLEKINITYLNVGIQMKHLKYILQIIGKNLKIC